MVHAEITNGSQQEPNFDQSNLERLYQLPGVVFSSETELREWLSNHSVDLVIADGKKGLSKLFNKIEEGEARMVLDEESGVVFRLARVAEISVEATFQGELYPLVELCQIFLKSPINEEALLTDNLGQVTELIDSLDIRSAQVRDSQKLWETLIKDENAEVGARRGLVEELCYTEEEAALAHIEMRSAAIKYEAPIDWPGIPSILETNEGKAVLPEKISKPAYVELEGGDQITIFVATPGAPVIRALLGKIIPNIHYVSPPA